MTKLFLVRHGQSLWNLENRFTGWQDIDITEAGIEEAKKAGIALKGEKIEAETALKYGDDQVRTWRRSFDVVPPGGESLKITYSRVIPYYEMHILPLLKKGENVLIVAHGNSLRALIMYLENLSPEEILEREIATGIPLTYIFDENFHISRIDN